MDGEFAARAWFAPGREPAADGLDQRARQRKAQPGSVDLSIDGRRASVERFEDQFEFIAGNTYPAVLNGQQNLSRAAGLLRCFRRYAQPAPVTAVFHRVGDEVLQAFDARVEIALCGRQLRFDSAFDLAARALDHRS